VVQENEPLVDLEREASPEVVIEREPVLGGEPGAQAGDSSRGPGGAAHDSAGRSQDEAEREPSGITRPSQRGSSNRFLTDVIVDMGFASRQQVDEAIETSRSTGNTPEKVLLDGGALTHDALSRALAERYGLDHLDLSAFHVDMVAANLVSTTAAK